MAKSNAALKKTYPDLSNLFAAKERSRAERAKEPPEKKFAAVAKLRKINRILKSAKVVKRSNVAKG